MKRLLVAAILLLAAVVTAPVALATPPFHTQSWDEPTRSAGNAATITSDKPDYHPGQIVTLTGTGWKPGELVTIVMVVDPVTHASVTLTAVADDAGNFTNHSYVVQRSDVNVTFTVNAAGDKGSHHQILR